MQIPHMVDRKQKLHTKQAQQQHRETTTRTRDHIVYIQGLCENIKLFAENMAYRHILKVAKL